MAEGETELLQQGKSVAPPTAVQGQAPAPAPIEDDPTFKFALSNGMVITVGRPRGVLKLRLRNLLGDFADDSEMQVIGQAFLSIRRWEYGAPMPLNKQIQFEAVLNLFKDDEELDNFINKFRKLTQPELTSAVETVLQQQLEEGFDNDELQRRITEITKPLAEKRLAALRDL